MFRDRQHITFLGASLEQMQRLHQILASDLEISDLQIVESVAYSFAMVIRAALGLHASDSQIGVAYEDSLSGWITLATARHLYNGGSKTCLINVGLKQEPSTMLTKLLKPLRYLKLSEYHWSELEAQQLAPDLFSSCHNLLCGVSLAGALASPETRSSFIHQLNDHSIPVHCISIPPGIDLDTGDSIGEPLYASSTLSLGVPYQALDKAREYIGRHYLADISLPHTVISEVIGQEFPLLFSEQPVIQIFPFQDDQS